MKFTTIKPIPLLVSIVVAAASNSYHAVESAPGDEKDRIVGGVQAEEGSYPYFGKVVESNSVNMDHHCMPMSLSKIIRIHLYFPRRYASYSISRSICFPKTTNR